MDRREQGVSIRWRRRLCGIFFQVLCVLGLMLGVHRNKLESLYIDVSNRLNSAQKYALRGEEILVLVPHCLQLDSCLHKITRHIENCRRCGGCSVGFLAGLQEKYGVHLGVATGGTLARQMVKEYNPRSVVAVACERDLASGITDVYPLPVLGVLLDRPNGPCFNTKVDLDDVEKAVRFFMQVEDV